MNHRFLTAFCVLGILSIQASPPPRQESLDAMITAERAFAELAAKTNTREAFLTFLADDAVMFSNGPCNGKELYAKNPADDSLLAWAPAFADMAASGDFGYDTGPYTYRPKRSDEKPAGHGQWVTIWKKRTDGAWRVAFDTGLRHPAPQNPDIAAVQCKTSAQSQKHPVSTPADSRQTLLEADQALNAQFKANGLSAYEKILSDEARLLYRGQFPAVGREVFLAQLKKNFEKDNLIEYEAITGETAASGDLGYIYGWVKFTSAQPEKPAPRSANYLRIWKRENGKDWRLVLELTGPG